MATRQVSEVTANALETILAFSLVAGSTALVSRGRKNLHKQTPVGRLHDVRISFAYCCTDDLSIPAGTHFQFRAAAGGPLSAVGVTMPPWPGDNEAYEVPGTWSADAST